MTAAAFPRSGAAGEGLLDAEGGVRRLPARHDGRQLVAIQEVVLLAAAEQEPDRHAARLGGAQHAAERSHAVPVPMRREGWGSSGRRVKNPCGPMARTTSPGESA